MSELLEKLTSATEGTRELDEDIALAICLWRAWLSKHRYWNFEGPNGSRFSWPSPIPKYESDTGAKIDLTDEPWHGWCWEMDLPNLSTSIDAALSALPPGWYLGIDPRFWEDGTVLFDAILCRPRIDKWNPVNDDWIDRIEARGNTMPLAAISAIVKAWEAEKS